MATDYIALKAELDAGHPTTGVYDLNDQIAADQLNAVNRTRNRVSVTGKEVKDRIDNAEWDSRTDAQKSVLLSMFARDDLAPFGIDAHIFTEEMTGAGGLSIASLAAYRVEDISRGDELGFGVVTESEVDTARRTA